MRFVQTGMVLGVLLGGCADQQAPSSRIDREVVHHGQEIAGVPQAKMAAKGKGNVAEPAAAPDRAPEAAAAEEASRKIIYTAHLDLVVEDIDKAQDRVEQAVQEAKGYIAKSELRGAPGSPRDGTWTLRVPVANFDTLRQALTRLGVLRRNSVDSEDITDRFYDTQARLKNNQVEEEGLRKLYQEKAASSKMEDLLAIRREMANIRGTIEQQQGQINRWDKQTRLATIELHLTENRDYVSPSNPGFGASISGTFWGSIDALIRLGKGVVLVLVALVPWLPLLALLVVITWLLMRRKSARQTAL